MVGLIFWKHFGVKIMAIVGYARVSSVGQSLEVQLEKLKTAHCTKIFQEKQSGLDTSRPQLKECLRYVREGDTLVITRLDRLARSTLHLHQIVDQLQRDNVALIVTDQSIDTSTPTGRLLFTMLAAIAQFETELRAERQRDGIDAARKNGKLLGRSKSLTETEVIQLRQQRAEGETIPVLQKRFKVGKTTVYRYLKPETEPS
jgi:DNA invertase Pin-like site-specific DNA recombinase